MIKVKRSELKKLAEEHLGKSDIESQNKIARMISVARVARISYMTFGKKIDHQADIKLYERLLTSGHFSPFEHCSRVMSGEEYEMYTKGKATHKNSRDTPIHPNENKGWCLNFKGFIQLRAEL